MSKFKNVVIYVLSVVLAFILGMCTIAGSIMCAFNTESDKRKHTRGSRVSYRRYYEER